MALRVLCAGTIPGMLELFPIMCTGAFSDVKKIYFKLTTDLEGSSDYKLEKQHGVGLTIDEYQKRLADGSVGWVVFEERIDVIADALGWKLDEIRRKVDPIICKTNMEIRQGRELEAGKVCGSHYLLSGMKDGEAVIIHDVWRTIDRGDKEMRTANTLISIEWEPDGVTFVVEGGCKPHWVAAAIMNRIPQVIEAKPGLVTVKDLPLLVCLK